MKLSCRTVSVRFATRTASSIKEDLGALRKGFDQVQQLFTKLDRYSRIMGELDRLVQNWEELRLFYKTVDSIMDQKSNVQKLDDVLTRVERSAS